MILVDTSIWIDHLRAGDSELTRLLEEGLVATHPLVIEELALGSLADPQTVLGLLANLRNLSMATHGEVMTLIESRGLSERGIGAVDAHLLASVIVEQGVTLWTKDRRLGATAAELGVAH